MLGETAKMKNPRVHMVYMDADEVELKNFRTVPHIGGTRIEERIYIENWWWEADYCRGEYVIKQTTEYFVFENLRMVANDLKHVQKATSLEGHNLEAYVTYIRVRLSSMWTKTFWPKHLETQEDREFWHEWNGDPLDTSYPTRAGLVAMEASDLTITDFACAVVKNDMDTNRDAGNSFENATSITLKRGIGYLGSFDTEDYYKLSVPSGWTITSTLEPPAGADFDLYLYDNEGVEIGRSTQRGWGVTESIEKIAATSGYYYVRVSRYSGFGTYSLGVTTPLSGALDTTLTITTGGDADWFGQNTTYYYDGDAAQSGPITHDKETWIQTTVTGPGTLKFRWKVSSEKDYDFLRFYIDGDQKAQISGHVDWKQMTYSISGGSHTLKWAYTKDYSMNEGYDTGWVDKLEFSPT